MQPLAKIGSAGNQHSQVYCVLLQIFPERLSAVLNSDLLAGFAVNTLFWSSIAPQTW